MWKDWKEYTDYNAWQKATFMPSPDPEQEFFRNMPLNSAGVRGFEGGLPCFPSARSANLGAQQVSLKSLLPMTPWLLAYMIVLHSACSVLG